MRCIAVAAVVVVLGAIVVAGGAVVVVVVAVAAVVVVLGAIVVVAAWVGVGGGSGRRAVATGRGRTTSLAALRGTSRPSVRVGDPDIGAPVVVNCSEVFRTNPSHALTTANAQTVAT